MSGPSIRAVLDHAVACLEGAGISSPRKNAEWLLCEVLGRGRASLYADVNRLVREEDMARFAGMLQRRARHEPLQYILGYTEFFGLRIEVGPSVLIPRPETEQVVEAALGLTAHDESARILDVGTGSGCIALAIKSKRPNASVWACDVDESALATARGNAALNGLDVSFFEADVLSDAFADRAPDMLHLLLSNPPYISEGEADSLPVEVRDFEPHCALFAQDDPLIFYRRLSDHGLGLLRPGGLIVLETHAVSGQRARDIFIDRGYVEVELRRDYAGHDRILIGRRPM